MLYPWNELLNMKFVGGDTIDWWNGAAKYMIGAVVLFGLFDGVDI